MKSMHDILQNAFVTSNSTPDGDYFVKIKVKTLEELHELHGAILHDQKTPNKFPNSSGAVQIAEEAFRAGWEARSSPGMQESYYDAWSAWEPSEASKDLARGDG